MTARELIEALEELPQDLPVIADCVEVTETVVRNEIYFSADHQYCDGEIIKIY